MSDATARIDALAAAMFQHQLASAPVYASQIGFSAHVSELPPISEQDRARQRHTLTFLRERVAAVDPGALDAERGITRTMLLREITDRLSEISAAAETYTVAPIPQTGLAAAMLVELPQTMLVTPGDGDAYVDRCRKLPAWLRHASDRLGAGRAAGRTPVRRLVANTVALLDAYLAMPLTDDPILSVADPAEGARPGWRDRLAEVIRDEVRPAFCRYRDDLSNAVLPTSRDDGRPGLAYLPGGGELYHELAAQHTTTSHDADELHRTGLDEVERLTDQMCELGERVFGTSDLAAITHRLRTDAELFFTSSDEIAAAARDNMLRAQRALPDWLTTVPTTDCVVLPMTPLESENGDLGHYQWPAADGSRPGTYWINTTHPRTRPRFESAVLAFHESVPGHHTQLALAQELPEQCEYRRHAHVTAFVEGWALYAERLADEMGLYRSDLDRIGMVSFGLWRACRLVVDTGMHAHGWTRRQAVDYVVDHTALTSKNVDNEVDRYISWPGQALGYLVGRLELERLRDRAQRRLGPRFRLPQFHGELLGHGALPWSVLDTVLDHAEGETAT
jgi:uncharacterized protein (DUF885 family)